jgi:hypothetical protein
LHPLLNDEGQELLEIHARGDDRFALVKNFKALIPQCFEAFRVNEDDVVCFCDLLVGFKVVLLPILI